MKIVKFSERKEKPQKEEVEKDQPITHQSQFSKLIAEVLQGVHNRKYTNINLEIIEEEKNLIKLADEIGISPVSLLQKAKKLIAKKTNLALNQALNFAANKEMLHQAGIKKLPKRKGK